MSQCPGEEAGALDVKASGTNSSHNEDLGEAQDPGVETLIIMRYDNNKNGSLYKD